MPAPRMVICVLAATMLPKGAVVIHHLGNIVAQTLQSLVGHAHHIEGVDHVSHHIRFGLPTLVQHFGYLRKFVCICNSGYYCKSLRPVVCRPFVTRSAIETAVPEKPVIGFFYPFHHACIFFGIRCLSKMQCKFPFSLQREIVPRVQHGYFVDIFPGVRPVPSLGAFQRETVCIGLPAFVKILVKCRVDVFDERVIRTVEPVVVEPVPAD